MKTYPLAKLVSTFFVGVTIILSCSSSENEEESPTDNTTTYDITPILSKFDGIEAVSYSVNGSMSWWNLMTHKTRFLQDYAQNQR